MLPQREPQVAPAVVVAQTGEREHAARLPAGSRQDQGGDRDVALVTAHPVNVRPGRIEERAVPCGEVQAGERALDEVTVVGGRAADRVDLLSGEDLVLVDHCGAGDDRGKRQEIVGRGLVSQRLEQVGHNPAAGERVECGPAAEFGEYPGQARYQAVLRPHIAQPGKLADPAELHGLWLSGRSGGHSRNPRARVRQNRSGHAG